MRVTVVAVYLAIPVGASIGPAEIFFVLLAASVVTRWLFQLGLVLVGPPSLPKTAAAVCVLTYGLLCAHWIAVVSGAGLAPVWLATLAVAVLAPAGGLIEVGPTRWTRVAGIALALTSLAALAVVIYAVWPVGNDIPKNFAWAGVVAASATAFIGLGLLRRRLDPPGSNVGNGDVAGLLGAAFWLLVIFVPKPVTDELGLQRSLQLMFLGGPAALFTIVGAVVLLRPARPRDETLPEHASSKPRSHHRR